MTRNQDSPRLAVLAAGALVVVLAGLFAARVLARTEPPSGPSDWPAAPTATVPLPAAYELRDLPTPYCWGCSGNYNAPLDFQIDLDLLAPLGTGEGNAATWLRRFTRGQEGYDTVGGAYKERYEEHELGDTTWRVLPADDPVLRATEPWIDQASASFYPEVFTVEGLETEVPNLLAMLDLARSWVYRGKTAGNDEAAKDDFRRAIRLGRLLRQDDVTVIQNLVAIACIRLGTEALYEQARDEGDGATMVAASLVLADKDAMRMNTMRRIHAMTLDSYQDESGAWKLALTDKRLEELLGSLRRVPDRTFRVEGMIALHGVKHAGTPAQREKAAKVLAELEGDPDELVAALAQRLNSQPFDPGVLQHGDGPG